MDIKNLENITALVSILTCEEMFFMNVHTVLGRIPEKKKEK